MAERSPMLDGRCSTLVILRDSADVDPIRSLSGRGRETHLRLERDIGFRGRPIHTKADCPFAKSRPAVSWRESYLSSSSVLRFDARAGHLRPTLRQPDSIASPARAAIARSSNRMYHGHHARW
jgi:hypothetical protein